MSKTPLKERSLPTIGLPGFGGHPTVGNSFYRWTQPAIDVQGGEPSVLDTNASDSSPVPEPMPGTSDWPVMSGDSDTVISNWTSANPHEALKPIEWLIGRWKSVSAQGSFPTISPFAYCEELTFSSYGQPLLNYSSVSWHPVKKCPMHLESGFLRVQPGTKNLAFMVAHNFGLTTIEEGQLLDNNTIKLTSVNISRMSFAKDPAVIKIERSLELVAGKLEVNLAMQTEKTETCQHLKAVYERM